MMSKSNPFFKLFQRVTIFDDNDEHDAEFKSSVFFSSISEILTKFGWLRGVLFFWDIIFKNKITFENFDLKDEIYLGIRPEDISTKNDREVKLDVKVDLVENLGFEKIIYTKLSETQIIIKSSAEISNQPLKISFSKDKVLFFDINKNRIRIPVCWKKFINSKIERTRWIDLRIMSVV